MDLINQITSRQPPFNFAAGAGEAGVWSEQGDIPADLVFARFYSEQLASSMRSGQDALAHNQLENLNPTSMSELAAFFNSDGLDAVLSPDELSEKFSAWLSSVGLASDGFRFSAPTSIEFNPNTPLAQPGLVKNLPVEASANPSLQQVNLDQLADPELALATELKPNTALAQPGLVESSPIEASANPSLQQVNLDQLADPELAFSTELKPNTPLTQPGLVEDLVQVSEVDSLTNPEDLLALDLDIATDLMPVNPLGVQSPQQVSSESITPLVAQQGLGSSEQINAVQVEYAEESALVIAAGLQSEAGQMQAAIQAGFVAPAVSAKVSALQNPSGLSSSGMAFAKAATANTSTVSSSTGLPLQNASAMADGFIAQALQTEAVRGGINVQALNLASTAQTLLQQSVIQQQVVQAQTSRALDESENTRTQTTETTLLTDSSAKGSKTTAPSLASISYPLNHQKWNEALGKRMIFMANQSIQLAQISLNPEKLGPIQLRLQLDRDQMMTVSMSANHATTREALEAAIPRLKEMLTEAGVLFDQIDVQEDSVFDQPKERNTGFASAEQAEDNVTENALMTTQLDSDNLIDFYA